MQKCKIYLFKIYLFVVYGMNNQKIVYQSTRNASLKASSIQSILEGIAPDGGLYTPSSFADIHFDWEKALRMDTFSRAAEILCLLLPDFSDAEMQELLQKAYRGKFPSSELTPTVPVGSDYLLELFHGPTSAFKDVALCLLPHLMQSAMRKCGCKEEILILTATSGDTGVAAMAGFCDVPGTRIIVFYPANGVSPIQRAQMITQPGKNVKLCAVDGNFDDAQSGVKRIFAAQPLCQCSIRLSSANSINIGRLAPQVVYYFTAYAALLRDGHITLGDKVDFSVPTGNFGDILAGFIARELGLPIGRLICASNANNVLTQFLRTGCYDRRRPFHVTLSPSMDILVSSNLERLLFLLSRDEALVESLMSHLNNEGFYQIPASLLTQLQRVFWAGCCNDAGTLAAIRTLWQQHHYLCDTHTAVAWNVAQQYKAACPDHNPVVILSTASPYKFPNAVLEALGSTSQPSALAALNKLHTLTNVPIPENLLTACSRQVRHFDRISPDEMLDYVLRQAEVQAWKA